MIPPPLSLPEKRAKLLDAIPATLALIAQRIEQQVSTLCVVGSNPTKGALNK